LATACRVVFPRKQATKKKRKGLSNKTERGKKRHRGRGNHAPRRKVEGEFSRGERNDPWDLRAEKEAPPGKKAYPQVPTGRKNQLGDQKKRAPTEEDLKKVLDKGKGFLTQPLD